VNQLGDLGGDRQIGNDKSPVRCRFPEGSFDQLIRKKEKKRKDYANKVTPVCVN